MSTNFNRVAYLNAKNDWKYHIEWDRAAYLKLEDAIKNFGERLEIFINPLTGASCGSGCVEYPTVYLKSLLKHLEQKYK